MTTTSPPKPTPSSLSSLPTPTIPASKAVLHISSATHINAPSSKVWSTLIDTSTWPEWNSFCPRVTIREQPGSDSDADPASSSPLSPILRLGTKMTFHVIMDPKYPERINDAPLVVTEFEPPDPKTGRKTGRIVWVGDADAKGAYPSWVLKNERVHEVEEVGGIDGEGGRRGTEVRNWEAQRGPMAYLVKVLFGEVLRRVFRVWVDELRDFVEGEEGRERSD